MNIRCYIVDDMRFVIDLITIYIGRMDELVLVGSSTDPMEAKNVLVDENTLVDVVFMDIEMPGLSGIELAMLLKGKTEIIFTTGYVAYAVDAFEIEAVDYLVKPVTFERFQTAIERLKAKLGTFIEPIDNIPYLFLPGTGKNNLVKVYYNHIRYIKANSNYMEVHTDKKTLLCYISITKILEMLPASRFVRVHKSYIVNLDTVEQIEANFVCLENGDEIPIGASYKESFMKKVKRY